MKSMMSDTYYNDLSRCAPMTPAVEREKAARMAALKLERDRLVDEHPSGRRPSRLRERLAEVERAYQRARNEFVCANLRLVVKIAHQYADKHQPLSDLIQEGNIGLMIAVERFDHTRGVRFCTYAAWWIRHRITRAISNHGRAVRVPNHIAQTSSKLLRARREFEARQGRLPSIEELAALCSVSAAKARLALRTTGHMLSLDGALSDDERPLHETLADDAELSVDELARMQRENDVNQALAELGSLELDILRKRFAFDEEEELTLRELGALHSLSRERIRQIQNSALRKVKRRLVHHA